MKKYNQKKKEEEQSRNTAGFRSTQQGYDHKDIERKWPAFAKATARQA